jgi:hypothetical protein
VPWTVPPEPPSWAPVPLAETEPQHTTTEG